MDDAVILPRFHGYGFWFAFRSACSGDVTEGRVDAPPIAGAFDGGEQVAPGLVPGRPSSWGDEFDLEGVEEACPCGDIVTAARPAHGRRRLPVGKLFARSKIAAHLEACPREYNRVLRSYTKGILSEADTEATLPKLRAEKTALENELLLIEGSPPVIPLHPTLVADYLRHVATLQELLSEFGRAEWKAGQKLFAAFQALIEPVTIHPGPPR